MAEAREFVNYQIEDHIAVVLVDRPPVNALNPQLEDELQAVFEELGARDDARAVIVTGGGEKAFIAGADIKTIAGKSPQEAFETSASSHRMLSKIEGFDVTPLTPSCSIQRFSCPEFNTPRLMSSIQMLCP